jgi:hypothetical protein
MGAIAIAISTVPIFVPSRLRAMSTTADVCPCAAASERQVKICSVSSYPPQWGHPGTPYQCCGIDGVCGLLTIPCG